MSALKPGTVVRLTSSYNADITEAREGDVAVVCDYLPLLDTTVDRTWGVRVQFFKYPRNRPCWIAARNLEKIDV